MGASVGLLFFSNGSAFLFTVASVGFDLPSNTASPLVVAEMLVVCTMIERCWTDRFVPFFFPCVVALIALNAHGHPGNLGKYGMRHLNFKYQHKFCPAMKLETLWNLVREKARKEWKEGMRIPVIDVTRARYFKVMGKARLPRSDVFR